MEPSALNLDRIGVREILHALPDGAYVTDAFRRILLWNQAAARITGWPSEEVEGRTCYDNLLVHIDKDGHRLCGQDLCPLHRSIVTGEMSHEPLLVFAQHRRGHRIPVEVTVAPIRDAGGSVVGGIEVFRDLTEMFKDLRRARTIQEHALTSELPDDPRLRFEVRYSPEGVVGGDFYRVEALDADRYAVLVADVMGHGVAAALYTMQLRTFWDDCRELLRSPAGFLQELNVGLGRLVGDDGHFATGVFVLLDLAAGAFTLVRAGHPAPFLLSAGSAARSVGDRSPAIGLVKGAVYRENRERLEAGDTLLLFTDGATEIVNSEGTELGEDGLRRMLDPERFAVGQGALEWLEERLLEYSQRIRLPDDLTLLSLHRPRLAN